jgi:hypothetical protein
MFIAENNEIASLTLAMTFAITSFCKAKLGRFLRF